jgi:type IV secretory pathway VirB9-like protein
VTNRRAYYFLLVSDASQEPAHYAMTYPDDLGAFQRVRRLASISARPTATHNDSKPNPARCIDDRYAIDRMPVFYYPQHVCNDGRHTFIVLQQFKETPSDLPVLFVVTDGSNAIANYIFDATHYRYVVDGVPDMMVLVSGSGKRKKVMRIQHFQPTGKNAA